MKSNTSGFDRIIRVILGIAIIGIGLYFHSWWGLVGVVLLITAAMSWCPIYWALKLSTKPKEKATETPAPPPPAAE